MERVLGESGSSPIVARADYRLGDGLLRVEADAPDLLDRIFSLYAECAVPAGAATPERQVHCALRAVAHSPLVLITFMEGAPSDPAVAALGLLHPPAGEPPYAVRAAPLEGWGLIGSAARPVVAARSMHVLFDSEQVSEDFLAEYLVSATLEVQPELMVLHAAALALGDAGILLAGPSRAGKTTTAAHLAARGHALLGDEMALVRMSSGELLPLRRSMSLRPGPRTPELTARLAGLDARPTPLSRGKTGPIRVDCLFPGSRPDPVRLGGVFFLDGFSAAPSVTPFRLSLEDKDVFEFLSANDTALISWGLTPARRTLRLLALKHLLARLPCWRLKIGSPAETAGLIERTMEER